MLGRVRQSAFLAHAVAVAGCPILIGKVWCRLKIGDWRRCLAAKPCLTGTCDAVFARRIMRPPTGLSAFGPSKQCGAHHEDEARSTGWDGSLLALPRRAVLKRSRPSPSSLSSTPLAARRSLPCARTISTTSRKRPASRSSTPARSISASFAPWSRAAMWSGTSPRSAARTATA